jgi:hypothetical protein
MEPNRFGRKLGIGVRIASRMAKERAARAAASSPQAAATQTASQAASQSSTTPRPPIVQYAKNYAEPARRVGEGTRRFGKAFIGPLAHVSGTLWLEITGLFFALFAAFFGQNAWRIRSSVLHGPDHAHFIVATLAALVFAWFSISSFVKAEQRSRKARSGRTTQ